MEHLRFHHRARQYNRHRRVTSKRTEKPGNAPAPSDTLQLDTGVFNIL